jgi:hypothetical protein
MPVSGLISADIAFVALIVAVMIVVRIVAIRQGWFKPERLPMSGPGLVFTLASTATFATAGLLIFLLRPGAGAASYWLIQALFVLATILLALSVRAGGR